MVVRVVVDVMALVWQHPVFSCLVLVFFTPPFLPILRFFSPLLVSTALFMLALLTVGRGGGSASTEISQSSEGHQRDISWEFRPTAHVKVWEDKSVGTGDRGARRWSKGAEGRSSSWDIVGAWLSGVQEAWLAWVDAKLRSENWKGTSALNDDNVSILQEAAWGTTSRDHKSTSSLVDEMEKEDQETVFIAADQSRKVMIPAVIAPSELFKVESKLKRVEEDVASPTIEMDEDAPELEDVTVELAAPSLKHAGSYVSHKPLVPLQIQISSTGARGDDDPKQAVIESPSTDLDDDSSDLDRSMRFLRRRNSANLGSGRSDSDTPAVTLSKSGKLKQIETLGDFLIEEDKRAHASSSSSPDDNHHQHHELAILQPTTADQVDAVKDKVENFTQSSPAHHHIKVLASSSPDHNSNQASMSTKAPEYFPLFKETKRAGKKTMVTTTKKSRSSAFSDSGSESEFEIFPPVDPKKMKLHPPVKLDIQHLEKKLGTSLSELLGTRTRNF